jgi:hypothetical protein
LFDHTRSDPKRLSLLWATVDEIADEDHLSLRMTIEPMVSDIVHPAQQPVQLGRLAMDVADDVVARRCQLGSTGFNLQTAIGRHAGLALAAVVVRTHKVNVNLA